MKERVGADPMLSAKADAYFEADRLAIAEDIEMQRPDIVLIQETMGFDFKQWIAHSPPLKVAMARYTLIGTVDGIEILQLRQAALGLSVRPA